MDTHLERPTIPFRQYWKITGRKRVGEMTPVIARRTRRAGVSANRFASTPHRPVPEGAAIPPRSSLKTPSPKGHPPGHIGPALIVQISG